MPDTVAGRRHPVVAGQNRQAVGSGTIELPTAVSVAAWAIAALLGILVWFLRREVKNNDDAHSELRGDVKKLLEGQGRIEGALGVLTGRRTGDVGASLPVSPP